MRGIVSLVAVVVIATLAVVLGPLSIFKNEDGGSDNNSGKNTSLPNVSVKGAKECKVSNGPPNNLTPERLPTCKSAKLYAKQVLTARGQGGDFNCLDELWVHESQWSAWALNTNSDAYGIAQILPDDHGTPVAIGDWKGQVDWGLRYIWKRYKTPCNAWKFWQCTSDCPRFPGGPVGKRGGPDDPKRTWY